MLVDMWSQVAVIVTVIALPMVAACDRKPRAERAAQAERDVAPTASPRKLRELSTSLAAAREAFNAHKGEARFLTLLSPT